MTVYDHTVEPLTVGQLRASLEGRPDDEPIQVMLADAPGSGTKSSQVIVAAESYYGLVAGRAPGTREVRLVIECDWPSGPYRLD